MPLDFPNDPVAGDIFVDAGARWQWDGSKWTSLMTSGGPFLPLSGGALTGPLILAADPVVALHAATKQYVDGHSGGSGYLPLTGGTLAGPLTVEGLLEVTTGHLRLINDGSTEDAFAYVDLSADIGGMNLIRGHSPGFAQTWWTLALGDGPPSADFSITRYNDAGGIIDHPLTISRATGVVTFGPVPPSTMRRFGEAPAVTATAGVGTLQGHPVNGTVIQGSGSTTDFLLNNKTGAAVLSVPTGTTNLTAAGSLAVTGAYTGSTINVTGSGQTVLRVVPSSTLGSGQVSGPQIQPALLSANVSGTVTTGQNDFYSALINSDHVDASALAGMQIFHIGWAGQSAAMKGNRTLMAAIGYVNATTGNSTGNGVFYTGVYAHMSSNINDNGTSGTPIGNLFGGNTAAKLTSGATFWNSLVSFEFDIGAQSGSSVAYKQGIKVVLDPLDAVQGSRSDYALGFALNAQGGLGTGAFKTVIQFGSEDGWWMANTSSTLIGTGVVLPGGPAMAAAYGIDFSAVTFGTAFLKSNGFLVDGSGNVTAAAGAFTALTAPTQAIGNESTAVATTAFVASAAGGTAGITLPDADTTLTTAQVERRMLVFSGTLTAPRTVTMPPLGQLFKVWLVRNGTAGAQSITIKGAAGTGVVITANACAEVWTDGTSIFGTQSEFPITAGFRIGDSTRNQVVVVTGAAPTNVSTISCLGTGGLQFTSNVSFNSATPIAKPTVSGAKASNAALASLIAALASYGLITDTTTA